MQALHEMRATGSGRRLSGKEKLSFKLDYETQVT